jgi:hypothetical protein
MTASPSQGQKYDRFLERVINEAQRLDADYRNFMALWEAMDEYLDEINEAPGMFKAFINGLKTSTIVLTHRLFDEGSVGIHELIRIAEKHNEKINWEGRNLDADDLQSQRDRIEAFQPTLERLKKQRHKAYAHLDKRQVLDPKAFAQEFPLDQDDIREAIDLAHDVLQEHYGARYNSHLEMKIVGAVSVRHLLELVREGRKCREEKRERRLNP